MWSFTFSGHEPKDIKDAHKLFKDLAEKVLEEFDPVDLNTIEFRSSEGHTEDLLTPYLYKHGRMTKGEAEGTVQSPAAQARARGEVAPEGHRIPFRDKERVSTDKGSKE